MKKTTAILFVAFTVLALTVLACGGGGAAPTQTPVPPTMAPTQPPATPTAAPTKPPAAPTTAPTKPPTAPTKAPASPNPAPTQPPAKDLTVVNVSGYKDSVDYFHVVGELHNATGKPLADIELTIEIKDANGKTLLKDDSENPVDTLTFSPFLDTLGPDEYSPFDYSISTEGGMPDKYSVTVTGQRTGKVNRAKLEVQNAQMVADSSGDLYITGELVNLGDKPAQINGFAGAALDKSKAVVAADSSSILARYLAPTGNASGSDRTPFIVTINGPVEGADQWTTYVDADETEELSHDTSVELAGAYFDTYDSFHVIGTVTNNGKDLMSVSLVAGVYDTKGVTLDADTLSVPIYLASGESTPYTFAYFSNVNTNSDEAKRVEHYTVQVDPYWTQSIDYTVVTLKSSEDKQEDAGNGEWKYTGSVVNTSNKALSYITVVVAAYDAEGTLVGTDWDSIFPSGDAIAAGDTNPFEVTLYLDPNVNTQDMTFKTFVQGEVK